MELKIESIRLDSGETLPLLCLADPLRPIYLPFLFVMLKLRNKQINTIRNHLTALRWLYLWAKHVADIDLEALMLSGDFDTLVDELESFGFWLRSGRHSEKIVGRIGNERRIHQALQQYLSQGVDPEIAQLAAEADDADANDWMLPSTFNGYLHPIEAFLAWGISQFVPARLRQNREESVAQKIQALKDKVRAAFEAVYMEGDSEVKIKGLSQGQADKILLALELESPDNPFELRLRFRAWIVFNLLLETGIRRGELLKMLTTDFFEENGRYYIRIQRRPEDPSDTRKIQPHPKTTSRTIEISERLYEELEGYVRAGRRPIRNGRRMAISHLYLVTSDRGDPLSLRQLNYIFDRLRLKLFAGEKIELYPHVLRHTFAMDFLRHCIEVDKHSMDTAKDELRQICGWDEESQMPVRYAAKYYQQLAGAANKRRQDLAWARLDKVRARRKHAAPKAAKRPQAAV